jgi:hypothetical protein
VEQDLRDGIEAAKKDAKWMLAVAGFALGVSLGGALGAAIGVAAGAIVNRILWRPYGKKTERKND